MAVIEMKDINYIKFGAKVLGEQPDFDYMFKGGVLVWARADIKFTVTVTSTAITSYKRMYVRMPPGSVIQWGNGDSTFASNTTVYYDYPTTGTFKCTITIPKSLSTYYTTELFGSPLVSIDSWLTLSDKVTAIRFGNFDDYPSEISDNLISVPNHLPSSITSTSRMFAGCTSFNSSNVQTWNMINVTESDMMFYNCHNFNRPIGSWNVGNITTMGGMFMNCYSFNQNLINWNMTNVTMTASMFAECYNYNQNITYWDTSNIVDASYMFYMCEAFDKDVDWMGWDSLEYADGMFMGCTLFNSNLTNWYTPNLTSTMQMFAECTSFNGDIRYFDVSNVENMDGMFAGCTSFTSVYAPTTGGRPYQTLTNWDVSNVENMNGMFAGCTSFIGQIGAWDVSNVNWMDSMFMDCTSFNQNISGWCVQNIPTKPIFFDYNTPSWNNMFKPVWGACP